MKKFLFLFLCFSLLRTQAQEKINFWEVSDTLNIKRKNIVLISESFLVISSLWALNEFWYADYPRSKFQFINDNNDWKQMDKIGHFFSSYSIGKVGISALNWAGISKKK